MNNMVHLTTLMCALSGERMFSMEGLVCYLEKSSCVLQFSLVITGKWTYYFGHNRNGGVSKSTVTTWFIGFTSGNTIYQNQVHMGRPPVVHNQQLRETLEQ